MENEGKSQRELNAELLDACRFEKPSVARTRALLDAGADPNARDNVGITPLHCAAMADLSDVCMTLLAAGADIDARNNDGNTPLHIASANGRAEICSRLISAGADIEALGKYDNTPLHCAAQWGRAEVCATLLSAGADVDARRKDGRLPEETTEDDTTRGLIRSARESRELEVVASEAKTSKPIDQAGQGRRRRI